ncbi:MAG TPA: hypothetical protein VKA60_08220 [Blastocatellia bacterium]|nr:hypothetical protein [Blastocatellia bacterium]
MRGPDRPVRPVAFGVDNHINFIAGRLDFNTTARRKLTFDQFTFSSLLKLVLRKQSAIRKARPCAGDMDDASNSGLSKHSSNERFHGFSRTKVDGTKVTIRLQNHGDMTWWHEGSVVSSF